MNVHLQPFSVGNQIKDYSPDHQWRTLYSPENLYKDVGHPTLSGYIL